MVQDVQHLKGAIRNFTLRLTLNLSEVVNDELEHESLAEIATDSVHVELVVEQFALLV